MVEFSRTFSMSAFEGVRRMRLRRRDDISQTTAQIIEAIRTVDADGATFDFEAAIEIDAILPSGCRLDHGISFYRDCIDAVVKAHRPIWARTITFGRKFVQKLEKDEQQCFAAAGLLDNPPSRTTVEWWDQTSGLARMIADGIRMEQARAAELKSLDHEIARLAALGITTPPQWAAIEDNKLGYDILSFEQGVTGPVAKVIEVKSTIASPPRFYVTRNEWDTCVKMGAAYHFHVWDMKNNILHERTPTDVAPHIPADQGTGKWSSVEIRLGPSPAAS